MKVKELIEVLKKMPQEEEVIIFDGPVSYTPWKVYVCGSGYLKGYVIID